MPWHPAGSIDMINVTEKKVLSSDGKHMLAGKVYLPEGEPAGIFHVVHGMTEYMDRYDSFMRTMADNGYICFGYDHLGHGYTVADKSELGFIAHKNGWERLAEDVRVFSDDVRKEYGENLPYYLMGHSMGSFVVRIAANGYVEPDRLVIMGSSGPGIINSAGLALVKVMRIFRNEKSYSPFLENVAFGSYGKGFDDGDKYCWLTKDKAVRDAYEADEYCGYSFTLSAMQDLIKLNVECNKSRWFKTLRKDMPVLFVSGSDDPVGGHGKGITKAYEKLKANKENVSLKIYPGCRHEILNDTCKEETVKDILDFIR